jgi:hypothetical protein
MSQDSDPTPNLDAAAPTLIQLAHQISLLLQELITAARGTTDPLKIAQLNTEMDAVDRLLTQVQQAQFASDDAMFAQTTAVLKAQAAALDDMATQIKKIVKDVGSVARIIGYITQAVTMIGSL